MLRCWQLVQGRLVPDNAPGRHTGGIVATDEQARDWNATVDRDMPKEHLAEIQTEILSVMRPRVLGRMRLREAIRGKA